MSYDLLIKNATLLTQCSEEFQSNPTTVGIVEDKIQYVGNKTLTNAFARKIINAEGAVVTPGFIDCHTHLVYGGSRADEFEMRLSGATYEEIAKAGGGIISTVKATREATFEGLQRSALKRIEAMQRTGTTTIEIKSGYGLDLDTEIKMLKVARSLEELAPVSVHTTFLGAHTIPPEYQGNSNAYIDYIIETVFPVIAAKNMVDCIDAFCESIAFSVDQVQRLFEAAISYGFPLKLHAEQLTNQQGAAMAARLGARSVDHLEYLSPDDCAILAQCNTVAVVLPGAYYFLKEQKKPPISALRKAGVDIAMATDCNPGSSPFSSLPLIMNMGCLLFGLTVQEAFKAVTINAAKALGIENHAGSIEVGKQADIAIWNTNNINDIVYAPTFCSVNKLIKKGQIV